MTEYHNLQKLIYRQSLFAFLSRAFRELNPGTKLIYGHYLRAMCYALERVHSGETKRLIIALPPRHLKSELVSVAFPAWVLGKDPTQRIFCASYNMDLARTFSLKSRMLMQAWFRRSPAAARRWRHRKKHTDQRHVC